MIHANNVTAYGRAVGLRDISLFHWPKYFSIGVLTDLRGFLCLFRNIHFFRFSVVFFHHAFSSVIGRGKPSVLLPTFCFWYCNYINVGVP